MAGSTSSHATPRAALVGVEVAVPLRDQGRAAVGGVGAVPCRSRGQHRTHQTEQPPTKLLVWTGMQNAPLLPGVHSGCFRI
ncbi:hypothetical protein GCM10018789_37300 [Streptomyces werraensis]|nr:hypothetical protein GCM10018789_37300 [Streptomyces werraensis]